MSYNFPRSDFIAILNTHLLSVKSDIDDRLSDVVWVCIHTAEPIPSVVELCVSTGQHLCTWSDHVRGKCKLLAEEHQEVAVFIYTILVIAALPLNSTQPFLLKLKLRHPRLVSIP